MSIKKKYFRLFSFLLWLIENPTLDSKFTSCLGTSFHSQLGHLIRCNLENITNFWIYNDASLTEENPRGNHSRVDQRLSGLTTFWVEIAVGDMRTVSCQRVFPSRTSILISVSAHFNRRQKDIETKHLSVKGS